MPFPKSLFLCDYHVGYADGKTDLYGLFNAIRPAHGYPHTQKQFCLFAQLNNGLGRVPFFVDIRFAATNQLTFTTEPHELVFPDRTVLVQLALAIEGCVFPQPGLYKLELFCENTWVADTTCLLL